jgi:hypothetical protein
MLFSLSLYLIKFSPGVSHFSFYYLPNAGTRSDPPSKMRPKNFTICFAFANAYPPKNTICLATSLLPLLLLALRPSTIVNRLLALHATR